MADVGSGGSSIVRTTSAVTTTSLANNVNWQSTIALAQGYRLMKIVTSAAARVRIYAGSTYQSADLNRSSNKQPTGDHGLISEYTTTAGVLSAILSPFVDGATFDGTNNAPITVTNLSGSTATITVTFTWIRTE